MLARLFWFTLVHTVFTAFGQSDYSFQVRKYQCEIESLLPTTTTISSTTRSSTTSTFEFQSVLRSCPRTQCPLSFQAFETAMNSADTDNNKFYEVISYYQTMKKTFPDEDVRISCMINGIEMLQIPEIAKILSATELKQYCAVMSSVRLGLPSNILVREDMRITFRFGVKKNEKNIFVAYLSFINLLCYAKGWLPLTKPNQSVAVIRYVLRNNFLLLHVLKQY